MKRALFATAAAVVLVPALSGCGSSAPPPFALSCKTTALPGGAIRAAVTVKNATSSGSPAYVYGPAFIWIRHIYPLLRPAQVIVTAGRQRVTGPAFVIPMVDPKHPAHLLVRFQRPPRRLALKVSNALKVQGGDASGASTCRIGP